MVGFITERTMLTQLLSLRDQGGPLSGLTEEDVRRLASGAEEVRCAAGEMLMRAGEPGDQVYVVLEGRLQALAPSKGDDEQVLTEIGPGGLVGEVELIVGGTRQVDIRAIEDTRLAALSRPGFDRLLADSPETWRHVTELVSSRVRRCELLPHLSRLFGPFEGSATELLQELDEDLEFLLVEAGENLFRQGDAADAAYIVISGSLRVAVDTPEGGEQIINEVARGETVGEMALLTDDPRSATIYAIRDSHLARISRQGFQRLIDHRPQTLLNLSRLIIDRLKRRSAVGIPRPDRLTCIGLVPAGDTTVPLEEVARDLAKGLAGHGSVALLTSASVDAALGQPGISQATESEPAQLRLAGFLHEKEETHRYLLYQADPEWSRWTERCARQADQVVLIADGEGSSELGKIENRLADVWHSGRAPRRSLLLLHPRDLDRPTGTHRWLSARGVDSVHHLRRGHAGDLGRTFRILAGRAVSLVLGGGGARGFAHL
ncbi:MAG: cyclic nucleotide-binding and patatin-like phospholipase domain-containing protein, partial [Thermoanaerobaculia bacterium]